MKSLTFPLAVAASRLPSVALAITAAVAIAHNSPVVAMTALGAALLTGLLQPEIRSTTSKSSSSGSRIRDLERAALIDPRANTVVAWARELARTGDTDPLRFFLALMRALALRIRLLRCQRLVNESDQDQTRRARYILERVAADSACECLRVVRIGKRLYPLHTTAPPVAALIHANELVGQCFAEANVSARKVRDLRQSRPRTFREACLQCRRPVPRGRAYRFCSMECEDRYGRTEEETAELWAERRRAAALTDERCPTCRHPAHGGDTCRFLLVTDHETVTCDCSL